jgi:hypothetical protein
MKLTSRIWPLWREQASEAVAILGCFLVALTMEILNLCRFVFGGLAFRFEPIVKTFFSNSAIFLKKAGWSLDVLCDGWFYPVFIYASDWCNFLAGLPKILSTLNRFSNGSDSVKKSLPLDGEALNKREVYFDPFLAQVFRRSFCALFGA